MGTKSCVVREEVGPTEGLRRASWRRWQESQQGPSPLMGRRRRPEGYSKLRPVTGLVLITEDENKTSDFITGYNCLGWIIILHGHLVWWLLCYHPGHFTDTRPWWLLAHVWAPALHPTREGWVTSLCRTLSRNGPNVSLGARPWEVPWYSCGRSWLFREVPPRPGTNRIACQYNLAMPAQSCMKLCSWVLPTSTSHFLLCHCPCIGSAGVCPSRGLSQPRQYW